MLNPSRHSDPLEPVTLFHGLSLPPAMTQPPTGKPTSSVHIPQVGFDRNQTLRRRLNEANATPSTHRKDPCAAYLSQGKTLVRPTSVEGWIESCASTYAPGPIRDFWEGVWNLSVCTWNYIAVFGEEPWKPPSFGFPLSAPPFWQGIMRNRQIFSSLDSFFGQCGLDAEKVFRDWVEGQVEFLYGRPISEIPLGMAALALNAPAESYWIEGLDTLGCPLTDEGATDASESNRLSRKYRGWEVDCDLDSALGTRSADIYWIQSSTPIPDLWTDWVVFVMGDRGEGRLYFRLQSEVGSGEIHSRLAPLLDDALGTGWGNVKKETFRALDPLEIEWPWIGLARSIHQLGSSLV